MPINIDVIKQLAKQQRERDSFFPEFARAKEINSTSNSNDFLISFDSEEEAKSFAFELRNAKKNGVSLGIDAQLNPANEKEVKITGVADSTKFVNNLRQSNFREIQKENLRQKLAHKDLAARKTYATVVNAATAGVPVAAYALHGVGRVLAAGNYIFGWLPIPGVGTGLKTAARACLDASSEILEHGASYDRLSAFNQGLVAKGRDVADKVGGESLAHRWFNLPSDMALGIVGGCVRAVGAVTNVFHNAAYKAARAIEGNGDNKFRKAAATVLKVAAAPLSIPSRAGDWMIKTATDNSTGWMYKAGSAASSFFGKGDRKFHTATHLAPAEITAPVLQPLAEIVDNTAQLTANSVIDELGILANVRKISNLNFSKQKNGATYAQIAEIEGYKVYVNFACSKILVKGRDQEYKALKDVSGLSGKVNEAIQAKIVSAGNITRENVDAQTPLQSLINALGSVAGQNTVNNNLAIGYGDKSLVLTDLGLKAANFSIKSGSVTLTCNRGELSVIKRGVVASGDGLQNNPDFFNILTDIANKKGEFKGEMKDGPDASAVGKPVAFKLAKVAEKSRST